MSCAGVNLGALPLECIALRSIQALNRNVCELDHYADKSYLGIHYWDLVSIQKWHTESLKKLKFKCPYMRNGIDLSRCPRHLHQWMQGETFGFSTGGSFATAIFYIFLTGIKKQRNHTTQSFLSTSYIDILIFWGLTMVRWKKSGLSRVCQNSVMAPYCKG